MFILVQASRRGTHSALRGTRWALPPDSPNPSDDRPSQTYSMTPENKAPVPLKLFLTSPSPRNHTLPRSQPRDHGPLRPEHAVPQAALYARNDRLTTLSLPRIGSGGRGRLDFKEAGAIFLSYIQSVASDTAGMSSCGTTHT